MSERETNAGYVTPAEKPGTTASETDTPLKPLRTVPPKSLPRAIVDFIYDGLELLFNARGIGWEFGTGEGLYIPKETRNVQNRMIFCLQTLFSILIHFLIMDIVDTILRATPGLGTPSGGSIFAFGSNTLEKYAISTGLHLITVIMISVGQSPLFVSHSIDFELNALDDPCLTGLEIGYEYMTLFAVIFLRSDPATWPPLADKPWVSTSLHEFWGQRWHQTIRRSTVLVGGYPFAFLFGPHGLALGVFLASAIQHQFFFYADKSGRMPGWPSALFFLGQAAGLAMEREWKRRTGRYVGRWSGRAWIALWLVVGGQVCSKYYDTSACTSCEIRFAHFLIQPPAS